VHADDIAIYKDGRQIPLESWCVPIRDEQGATTAIITAFQDISHRRAIENELAGYRTELEQRVVQRTAELAALNTSLGARVAELSSINDISRTVATIYDVEATLQKVAQILVELYGVTVAAIALIDPDRKCLRIVAQGDQGPNPLRIYLGRSFPYAPTAEPGTLWQGPTIIDDLEKVQHVPADIRADLRGRGVASILAAPLIARDEELGVIALVTDDPRRAFSADELRVAQTVAGQVAAAIDAMRLLGEARRQRDMAEALRQTTSALSRSLDQQNVLGTILEQLYLVIAYEGAAVALVEGDELVIVDAKGLSARNLGRRVLAGGQGAGLAVLQDGRPLLIDDTLTWDGWDAWNSTQVVRSWLGVPLVSSEGVIGVLNLDSTSPYAFVPSQIDLLMTFADQAAIAVVNARLYEQAQDSAAANERQRLARDLHDAVTQTIFSASLVAASLPVRLNGMTLEALADVQMLQLLTRGALAEMRTLLLELRPEHLRAARLDLLLSQLAEAFAGRTGISAAVNANCDPTFELPYSVKVAAYRVVQEALTNIAKHAQAMHVTINCTLRPQTLRVAVIDDGRGFHPAVVAPERLGLAIMRERAAEIGAELTIDSEPGLGTHLFLTWSETSNFYEH
jgi:signal transduction histidine kinase